MVNSRYFNDIASPDGISAQHSQLEAFRRTFGRDPTDNAPFFFDPDAHELCR